MAGKKAKGLDSLAPPKTPPARVQVARSTSCMSTLTDPVSSARVDPYEHLQDAQPRDNLPPLAPRFPVPSLPDPERPETPSEPEPGKVCVGSTFVNPRFVSMTSPANPDASTPESTGEDGVSKSKVRSDKFDKYYHQSFGSNKHLYIIIYIYTYILYVICSDFTSNHFPFP